MYRNLLEISVMTSIKAGLEILKIYENGFSIDYKADNSPLTDADRASNAVITEALKKNFPEIPLLSEEGKDESYETRKNWKRLWLVDPLDGTKEFIKRNGEFTVNIALIESGRPVLGVIYIPVTDILYFASADTGSFKSEKVKDKSWCEVMESSMKLDKNTEEPETSLKVVASRSHINAETLEFIRDIERSLNKKVDTVSAGSSLKFCLIAENAARFYPRFAPTMEWDTAAGDAIVTFSGGSVHESETGIPLKYNKESLLNPWFVAHK